MAAVEKRKNAWVALLLNHLLFMFICVLTVPLLKDILQFSLGALLAFLYYSGIYDYSRRAGKEHISPYFETEFSWKFPLAYSLIGVLYFSLGIIINLVGTNIFPEKTLGSAISLICYFVWDSPFIFLNVFQGEQLDKLNIWATVVLVSMFFMSAFLGYAMGRYEKKLGKFMRKFRKNKKVRKALR